MNPIFSRISYGNRHEIRVPRGINTLSYLVDVAWHDLKHIEFIVDNTRVHYLPYPETLIINQKGGLHRLCDFGFLATYPTVPDIQIDIRFEYKKDISYSPMIIPEASHPEDPRFTKGESMYKERIIFRFEEHPRIPEHYAEYPVKHYSYTLDSRRQPTPWEEGKGFSVFYEPRITEFEDGRVYI